MTASGLTRDERGILRGPGEQAAKSRPRRPNCPKRGWHRWSLRAWWVEGQRRIAIPRGTCGDCANKAPDRKKAFGRG